MIDKRLVHSITENFQSGYNKDQIYKALINLGYSQQDIQDTINYVEKNTPRNFHKKPKHITLFVLPILVIMILVGGFFIITNFQSEEQVNQEITLPKTEPDLSIGEAQSTTQVTTSETDSTTQVTTSETDSTEIDIISSKTKLVTMEIDPEKLKTRAITEAELEVKFSQDGIKVLYVLEKNNQKAVVVDGIVGEWYDRIMYLQLAPNGDVVYQAKKSDDWLNVINGEELEGLTIINDFEGNLISYSPDGNKFAYAVHDNNQGYLVTNMGGSKPYSNVYSPVFNKDGSKLAYPACSSSNNCFVVLNDQEGKPYNFVSIPIFSPDGNRLAYISSTTNQQGNTSVTFVVDGNEIDYFYYDHIERFKFSLGLYSKEYIPFIFSPDSKKFAYIKVRNGKELVVSDGKEGSLYDYIDYMLFSPDGSKLAYVVINANQESVIGESFVVVNGKKGRSYGRIGTPVVEMVFSPDSQNLAYVAEKDLDQFPYSRQCLVFNEEEKGCYEGVKELLFNQDSSSFAYVASNEVSMESPSTFTIGFAVIRDGKMGKISWWVGSLVFSPDDETLAYIAMVDNKYFLVINETQGDSYDMIYGKPEFSPDGKYISYGARIGNELLWVVDEVKV